jgi:hypothetical protein
MNWGRDEHVTLLCPTGGGKTTTVISLIEGRPWVIYIATKPRDATVDRLVRDHGFKVAKTWEDTKPSFFRRRGHDKWILWVPTTNLSDAKAEAAIIRRALQGIYEEGAWTIVADELDMLCDQLGLDREFKALWQQGRAMDIAVVAATQRPAWVPLAAYSQATWVFLGKTSDERDLQRLSELGGFVNTAALRELLPRLESFQYVAVNTRTGDMFRTRVPAAEAV